MYPTTESSILTWRERLRKWRIWRRYCLWSRISAQPAFCSSGKICFRGRTIWKVWPHITRTPSERWKSCTRLRVNSTWRWFHWCKPSATWSSRWKTASSRTCEKCPIHRKLCVRRWTRLWTWFRIWSIRSDGSACRSQNLLITKFALENHFRTRVLYLSLASSKIYVDVTPLHFKMWSGCKLK